MRHALPAERIDGLPSGDEGLATGSVPGRRQRHGDNAILPGERRHGLQPLLDASADPMVWFLAAAALLYAVIGDRFEALVLTAALVPIIGLDLWLHRRTRASTGALADVIADTARVLRDGREQDIAAVELVVGDLVLLGPDQPVPADGVLVAADRLQVDEALLSGEPLPQAKQAMAACAPWPDSVDHAHWASAGTRVLDGHGRLRVVATGADTLYGELVRSAQAQPQARTPMQAAVRRLVALLLVAAVLLCLTLFAARWWQGFGLVDALVGAATLAVAALPEEFPVVLTLFLGLGVFRLARRRALVRRAVVVENIGRTTWLCSDKTGTLTEGRMRLVEAVPAPGWAGTPCSRPRRWPRGPNPATRWTGRSCTSDRVRTAMNSPASRSPASAGARPRCSPTPPAARRPSPRARWKPSWRCRTPRRPTARRFWRRRDAGCRTASACWPARHDPRPATTTSRHRASASSACCASATRSGPKPAPRSSVPARWA